MSKSRIAILGGNSFLASYVQKYFADVSHEVDSFQRNGEFKLEYPSFVPPIDILLKYDTIIITASAGVQSGKVETDQIILGLNAFYPIQLIMELEKYNYKGKVVTFGSYFEIGNCGEDKFLNEYEVIHSDLDTRNLYALSKRLLSRFCSSYSGPVAWYHLILPSVYGKGENPSRLIPYLIGSVQAGNTIKVTKGAQVRQYLHASDVVSFIDYFHKEQISPGIYNLSPDESLTIAALRSLVIEMVASDSKFVMEIIQGRDENMRILQLDSSKARSYGWLPSTRLKKGIQSYFE